MTASTVATGPGAAGAATAGAARGGAARAGAAGAAGIPAALTPGGAQAVFRATLDALARPGTVQRLPTAADEPLAAHVPAALLPLLALADLSTPACVVASAVARVEDGGVDGAAETDAAPVAGEVGSGGGLDGGAAVGTDVGADVGTDVGAGGRAALDEIVRVATSAPRSALGDARLVTALRPLTPGELASLRRGTAAAPEDGALACLAVAGIAITEGTPPVSDEDDASAATDEATDGADGARSASQFGDAGLGDGARLLLRISGPGVPGTRAVIVTGLPAGFAAARRALVAGFPAGADLLLVAPDGAMTGLPRTATVREEAG